MPAAELNNIILTVGIVQLSCDLLANRYVFVQDSYQRSLGALSRAKFKFQKLKDQDDEGKLTGEKQQKKLQRAKDELSEISANVAKRHTTPNVLTSLAFIILYRILAIEYSGKVIALLPFVPWKFIQKLTTHGLDISSLELDESEVIDPRQACSFIFVYILTTLSVKFFVHRAVAVMPPKGADGGILSMVDAPQNQKVLKQFGLDNETLYKEN
mmetsp:Transcript_1512/g.2054  ORF Transcript_1512/g.2054 Transcript_1512/m.2054 type:complete len:213 (-) Transcript_1512:433-1071(-)|eukprot:CAMPEP_0178914866 /NCGR_PEP_ID=MMETSP0786-20121207/11679_1 /TAXON_ID=186022 /ORGANISM="Thalassionema frauenfeldii, Strain CCMP 1798" /LENGTH=212 /DNA_ID=CAMNT_0020587853 /DNA_START=379 /DNA_END=1017 /DNA_ORIENTATION=+